MRAFEHLGALDGSVLFDCTTDEVNVRQGLIALAARGREKGQAPSLEAVLRTLATPTIGLPQGAVELMQHAIDTYSENRCLMLASLLAANETWQVPTLIRIKTMLMPNLPEFPDDPNLKYVAPAVRTRWREALEIFDRPLN